MNISKVFIGSILLSGALMAGSFNAMDEAKEAFAKEEYTKAFSIFSDLARKGDVKAQYFCAGMYEFAQGVEQNDAKALYWYEKAAEQGMRDAQQAVAYRYMQGIGTEVNKEKATHWYLQSARSVSEKDRLELAQWFDPANDDEANN